MFWNTNSAIFISFILASSLLLFPPQKSQAFFTKKTDIQNNYVSADYWENYDFSTPEKAANSIGKLLLSKNSNTLYENLAEDIAGIYTKGEFAESIGNVNIQSFSVVGNAVYTTPSQSYVVTKITFPNGTSKRYKTVLNNEDGKWKLLGTSLIE